MTTSEAQRWLPLPPGSFGFPFFGETMQFVSNPRFIEERQQRYGPVFKTLIFGRPTVVMIGAEANRFILSGDPRRFSSSQGWPPTFHELLGRSLVLQDDAEHARNRRLLMPPFHTQALEQYVPLVEQVVLSYLHRWEQLGTFTWLPEFKQLAFEVASILFLGAEPGEESAHLSRLFDDLDRGLSGAPPDYHEDIFSQALRARDELRTFVRRAVQRRQREPAEDALGLLVRSRDEQGNGLAVDELTEQVLTLVFAGHETTPALLTSLCMVLAQHPEVLSKARAEQQGLALQDSLTLEQLGHMRYLAQILMEVERLYPPTVGAFRGVINSFEFNGYYIPKGWVVHNRIFETQRDSRIFTHPARFDPERFSQEHPEHTRDPFSFIPFGHGARRCLGEGFAQIEAKIVASHLLRDYAWELLLCQSLDIVQSPTTRPRDGLRVSFRKRSRTTTVLGSGPFGAEHDQTIVMPQAGCWWYNPTPMGEAPPQGGSVEVLAAGSDPPYGGTWWALPSSLTNSS